MDPQTAWTSKMWVDWFKSAGFLNTGDIQDARRFRAAYRQSVMNRDQSLTGPMLETFVDKTLPAFKDTIVQHFKSPTNSEQMTDAVVDFGVTNRVRIDDAIKAFRQSERNVPLWGTEKNLDSNAIAGKDPNNTSKLRSRYVMGGEDSLAESWAQELSDDASGKAFNWQPSNEQGDYNLIVLRNLEHQSLVTLSDAVPRDYRDLEYLTLPFPVLPQYESNMPDFNKYMVKQLRQEIVANTLKRKMPNVSVALHDEQFVDGQETIMQPNILPPPMRKDDTQSTNSFSSVWEFRDIFDNWRYPQKPPVDYSYPMIGNSLQKIETEGFDYLQSF